MTLIIKGCAKLRAFAIPWDIFGYLFPSFFPFTVICSLLIPFVLFIRTMPNTSSDQLMRIGQIKPSRHFSTYLTVLDIVISHSSCSAYHASVLRILFWGILSAFIPLRSRSRMFFLSLCHPSPLILPLSFSFFLSMYISSSSVSCRGNYGAVTQNQIEEMCEASLMFTRAPQAAASRRLSCV